MLGGFGALVVAGAIAYPQRSKFTSHGADLSRSIIGDERTAQLESYYFRLEDRVNHLSYTVLGRRDEPFSSEVRVYWVADPPAQTIPYVRARFDDEYNMPAVHTEFTMVFSAPTPMIPPATKQVRDTLDAGEGTWTTLGLPRTSPNDMLMAKTFIRPDKSRPYATVGVLLLDTRRIKLNMRGGTLDPGGHRGVAGSGVISKDEYAGLLVAFNGGFKGPHGNYGMFADGKEYVPLRNGLASIATYTDGSIKMGEWGKDLAMSPDVTAVRQNAVLLVRDCEVSSRVREGNDTWGYVAVNSAEFITWRSAVGMTKDGNLLVAAGTSLSAETLAKAMWAAGACTAMQLDINSPYVLTSLYTPAADGSLKSEKFMESMPDNPARFLRTNERDFLYITLEESRYYPSIPNLP